jgi:hypothetical protein
MPAKAVVSIEGNLRNYGITAAELAEEREPLDPARLAEMMYQGFEQNVAELGERGISLPPPTDMNGRIVPGYEGQMYRAASGGGMVRQGSAMPSSSERAISSLMEVRDDMLRKFSAVSQDPMLASTMAMSIQKLEAEIISMGGEVERFDPAKYQSGLRPVAQAVDQKFAAEKVVENTKQAYTLRPIYKIFSGPNKVGKHGVCISINNAPGLRVRGTVVPRSAFTGSEVIDYVPDGGRGRMTVKTASKGYWEDVTSDFEVAWVVEKAE